VLAGLLGALAWVLFGIAGLAFWFGGKVIHAFTRADRALAEIEGMAIAVLSAMVGAVLKGAQDRVEEGDKPKSLGRLFENDGPSRGQAYAFFARRLQAKKNAETMTMVGPTVEV
jgi:hypothetical protein